MYFKCNNFLLYVSNNYGAKKSFSYKTEVPENQKEFLTSFERGCDHYVHLPWTVSNPKFMYADILIWPVERKVHVKKVCPSWDL